MLAAEVALSLRKQLKPGKGGSCETRGSVFCRGIPIQKSAAAIYLTVDACDGQEAGCVQKANQLQVCNGFRRHGTRPPARAHQTVASSAGTYSFF
ncbi:hypothetical protein BS78_01G502400 [Paspalum vaginatum]|nr:hypothetical protein BS78_01G502400 [Paspalum vaginatum]